jgi:hypothetical protein
MASFFKPTGHSVLINLDQVVTITFNPNQNGAEITFNLCVEVRGNRHQVVRYGMQNAYDTDVQRLYGLGVAEQP